MIAISAHYDGKVIIPDEPVDLPLNEALIVRIESAATEAGPADQPALAWIAEHACDSPDLPPDLSAQHDHYLYGTPKRDAGGQ